MAEAEVEQLALLLGRQLQLPQGLLGPGVLGHSGTGGVLLPIVLEHVHSAGVLLVPVAFLQLRDVWGLGRDSTRLGNQLVTLGNLGRAVVRLHPNPGGQVRGADSRDWARTVCPLVARRESARLSVAFDVTVVKFIRNSLLAGRPPHSYKNC